MEDIISKKLLSEILDVFVDFNSPMLDKNILSYEYQDPYCTPETYIRIKDTINIYEFAFNNCINFALKYKYSLYIDTTCCEVWKDNMLVHSVNSNKKTKDNKAYESVIKACEWIYDKENL